MKNSTLKIIIFCLITLSSINNFAQVPGSENDTSNLETMDAPINDYLIPMLVLGIVLSFFLIKKKKVA
jgi:hypothetical protein